MNVSIGSRWENFVDEAVKSGRYGSASEVVREGLRLVEEREGKLKALRDTINSSIAEGGSYTVDEVDDYVRDHLDAWEASGRSCLTSQLNVAPFAPLARQHVDRHICG